MSPMYEKVRVAPEHAEEFKSFLNRINGSYEKELASPEELVVHAENEWQRQVTEARGYINQFSQPEDSNTAQQINANFVTLIREAFSAHMLDDTFVGKIRDDIDWFMIRDTFLTEIEKDLPDRIPEDIVSTLLVSKGLFSFKVKSAMHQHFSPRSISALILSYGLHNGAPLAGHQGSKILGVKKHTFETLRYKGITTLRRNRQLRELLLEESSEY